MIDISGYQVQEKLYENAQVILYRGRRLKDDQRVMLKILAKEYPTPEEIYRLEREYATIAGQHLDGVVRAYGLERYRNGYAVVMEDFHGEPLMQLRERSFATLPLAAFLPLGIRISEILGNIHAKDLIYCSVNPFNIFWDRQTGEVKLFDLSSAVFLSDGHPVLDSNDGWEQILAYIAPEQSGRMNCRVDFRADFYALGVLFYELLAGELPFKTSNIEELLHCHIARTTKSLHDLKPEIPQVISKIVMKLMAKMPEDRYQNALGIKADLVKCLAQLTATGQIEAFAIGEQDVSQRFRQPHKLYGRERAIMELMAAFTHICEGSRAIVYIAGYSGIGKTALIEEFRKAILPQGAYFLYGKFAPINQNSPYSAFIQALRKWLKQILTESQERLDRWQQKIFKAIGINAQILFPMLPELEWIIGKQPSVPELAADKSQTRFEQVLQNFMTVLADQEHQVIFCLDDMQWADLPSLRWIELLTASAELKYILGILCYREDEAQVSHPLLAMLSNIEASGGDIRKIELKPLLADHIESLIGDAFRCSPNKAQPLAKICLQKTGGNPFFVGQFFHALCKENLIAFDPVQGFWNWDIGKIKEAGLTKNVADWMSQKIAQLPQITLEALQLAACMGSQFDMNMLALIRQKNLQETERDLANVIADGFILPLTTAVSGAQADSDPGVPYKFMHDQFQETAYALIGTARAKQLHWHIGRWMMENFGEDAQQEKIFAIVEQLNCAIELITEPAARHRLAKLNLIAGKKAKLSNAFSTASRYLQIGIAALSEDAWATNYDTVLALHQELAEAEYLNGNFEQARLWIGLACERVRSDLERAEFYNILIGQYTMSAQYEEAIETGRNALALFGVELPRTGLPEAVQREIDQVWHNLGDREIASLIALPMLTKPEQGMVVSLLANLSAPAFYAYQQLFYLIAAKEINIFLNYGHVRKSCSGYSWFAMLLGPLFNKYQTGYEFGKLALALADKHGDGASKCRTCNMVGNFVMQWTRHIRETEPINDEGYKIGVQYWELEFAGYILGHKADNAFFQGKNLQDISLIMPEYLAFVQKTKNQMQIAGFLAQKMAMENLLGNTAGKFCFDIKETSESKFMETCRHNQTFLALCYFLIFKAQVLYLYGEYRESLKAAMTAKEQPAYPLSMVVSIDHNFYHSLTLAALYPEASHEEQSKYLADLESNQRQMASWQDNCPENFGHRYLLVEAERARIQGKDRDAMELYDRAIESAGQNGFIQNEALANELAGKFYLGRKQGKLARIYIEEAFYGYVRWGAKTKIHAIKAKYPQFALPIARDKEAYTVEEKWRNAEIHSIVKVAQTMSEENTIAQVLDNLMKIIAEIAGAEKALLLLERQGRLFIEANYCDKMDRALVTDLTLDEATDLAVSIVHYAQRTKQDVLMGETLPLEILSADPYVARVQPKSLLCLIIQNQGRFQGILYLENRLAADSFPKKMTHILKRIATQAAISLENAILYKSLEQEIAERKAVEKALGESKVALNRYNEHLEEEVEKRTAELIRANRQLREEGEHRQRIETELLKAKKLESLGILAGGIAHDFNNYLASIMGNTALILDLLQNPNGKGKELDEAIQILNDLQETSREAKGLTHQLLTFAKGGTPVRKPTAFADLLRRLVPFSLRGSNIAYAFEIEEKLWWAETDETQMVQVIQNLIVNAKDAMPKGGRVTVAAQNIIIGQEHNLSLTYGKYVKISVTDTGVGIPEENLGNIFEPYFTTKPQGNGLGLAIAYSIIKKHDGYLGVTSQLGVGTAFYFYLPACGAPLAIGQEQSDKANASRKGKILFMDDDEHIRKCTVKMLTRLGYEVSAACKGEEAIAIYRKARDERIRYDAVIMDLTIAGGMGGMETITELLKIDPTVRAVVSSGYNSDDTMASYRAHGFCGVLAKPYTLQELKTFLNNLLVT